MKVLALPADVHGGLQVLMLRPSRLAQLRRSSA
jgi:hypothetical protein